MVQTVTNLPAMQETWVWSLGQEDPPGEGNGYPLQYCCMQNSMDWGVWQATVHGVAELDMTEQLTLSVKNSTDNMIGVALSV